MQFQALFFLSLLCCASAQVSYKTKSLCTTRFGTKSVTPKSTGYAITVTVTYRERTTTTPITTVTPPAVLTTVTSTKTATVSVTSTARQTVTKTRTVSSTALKVVTSTLTQTSIGSTITISTTTTVPAAPGFTAVRDSPDYLPRKRSRLEVRQNAKYRISSPKNGNVPVYSPQLYPTATTCVTLVQAITTSTKTFTAPTSTKTLQAETNTLTKTVTSTSTSTVFDGTSLVTRTSTTTIVSTSTTTKLRTTKVIGTATVEAPAATAYAQCQSNNLVGSANGNLGIGGNSVDNVDIAQNDDETLDACCASCASNSNCAGYLFVGFCYIYTTSNCANNQAILLYYTSPSIAADAGYFVGNGQCGQYGNGGTIFPPPE